MPSETGIHVKRILITGGAGFVGSNLARTLLNLGHKVYIVDNLITGQRELADELNAESTARFVHMDVTDNAFPALFVKVPIDEVYHLACPTGVPNIEKLGEEMLLASSLGTRHALDIARYHGARFLFTSTAEVYGQPEVTPQPEEYTGNVDPIGPRSPYEEGKRFGESLVTLYVRKYGVNARIVRIFNTYGPGMAMHDTRVMSQFMRSAICHMPIVVYGDGSQTRTHCFVDDSVRGLLVAMEHGVPGDVYNVGGSGQITVRELAERIIRCVESTSAITHKPHFIEDTRTREPVLEKIRALGWEQRVGLDEGISAMHVYARPRVEMPVLQTV